MNLNFDEEIKPADDADAETLAATIGATDKDSGSVDYAPGTVLGEAYEVLALIGSGAMGNVYHVRHSIMHKEFALKTLRAEQVSDKAWRRFQNEAQAIARMNHPNVVAISNLGLHQGYLPYYVMDLLDGRTLQEILEKRRALPVNEAVELFVEACAGIGYAHKKGIVHRDIKPGNIVILNKPEASSRLKIVDFGIAKLSATKDLHNQQITKSGETCGSPLYMSPEQCQSGRIDARSDVYSLGCTLFETLTGSPPFKGKSAVETMQMHQNNKPPTLSAAAGGKQFTPMLESVVASMLAKTPMDRYQNMELLAQDLAATMAGKDLPINPYGAGAITRHRLETLNAVETAKEGKPWYKSDATRLPAAAVLAVGLALVVSRSWCYWLQHPQKNNDRSALTAPSTAKAVKGSDVPEDVFKAIADVSGEGSDTTSHISSATDTEPFSHDEKKHGKVYRVFHFPKDVAIGVLRDDTDTAARTLCLGTVQKPPEQKLIFIPDPVIKRYPQYLKRFRPGDIYGVAFHRDILDDRTLASAATIPGVHKLRIEDSSNLTFRSLASLYKFDSLDDFRYGKGPFSGEDITKMPRFNHLTTLFYNGKNVSNLLVASQKAGRLETLNVLLCPLSKKDIAIISTLRQLHVLAIGPATLTSTELEQLAKLPNLNELHIQHCNISPEAIAQFKQFQGLRLLGITDTGLSRKQLQDLAASLPHVLLK